MCIRDRSISLLRENGRKIIMRKTKTTTLPENYVSPSDTEHRIYLFFFNVNVFAQHLHSMRFYRYDNVPMDMKTRLRILTNCFPSLRFTTRVVRIERSTTHRPQDMYDLLISPPPMSESNSATQYYEPNTVMAIPQELKLPVLGPG